MPLHNATTPKPREQVIAEAIKRRQDQAEVNRAIIAITQRKKELHLRDDYREKKPRK